MSRSRLLARSTLSLFPPPPLLTLSLSNLCVPVSSCLCLSVRAQVNFVLSSKFGDDEAEFLFAPFSACTVEGVDFKCVRVVCVGVRVCMFVSVIACVRSSFAHLTPPSPWSSKVCAFWGVGERQIQNRRRETEGSHPP